MKYSVTQYTVSSVKILPSTHQGKTDLNDEKISYFYKS